MSTFDFNNIDPNQYGTNNNKQSRKSKRVPKAPVPVYQPSSSSPKAAKSTPSRLNPTQKSQREFLSQLYREVNDAATTQSGSDELAQVHKLLRFAKLNRFLQSIPVPLRQLYTDAIRQFSHQTRRIQDQVHSMLPDLNALHGLKSDRLQQFIDQLGYPLLGVCAYSVTFRIGLTKPASTGGPPRWSSALGAIENNASSLEFFARARGLEPWDPNRPPNGFFGVLKQQVFTNLLKQDGKKHTMYFVYGIDTSQTMRNFRDIPMLYRRWTHIFTPFLQWVLILH